MNYTSVCGGTAHVLHRPYTAPYGTTVTSNNTIRHTRSSHQTSPVGTTAPVNTSRRQMAPDGPHQQQQQRRRRRWAGSAVSLGALIELRQHRGQQFCQHRQRRSQQRSQTSADTAAWLSTYCRLTFPDLFSSPRRAVPRCFAACRCGCRIPPVRSRTVGSRTCQQSRQTAPPPPPVPRQVNKPAANRRDGATGFPMPASSQLPASNHRYRPV